ncbi:MAG: hypothetical protein OCC49_10225 [Fibrobacterales bacterium]
MILLKNILFTLTFSALLSSPLFAAEIVCSDVKISEVYIEAERIVNAGEANTMTLRIDNCSEFKWVALPNTHQAYSGMVAIALMAYKNNLPVKVKVNDSKKHQYGFEIHYIGLKKSYE